MGHTSTTFKPIQPAEDDIGLVAFYSVPDPLIASEPNQLHCTRIIFKMSDHPFSTFLTDVFNLCDLPFYLNLGIVAWKLIDGIKPASINIPIGKKM
jgi:hypothetical protein